jgi:hypothetical protein
MQTSFLFLFLILQIFYYRKGYSKRIVLGEYASNMVFYNILLKWLPAKTVLGVFDLVVERADRTIIIIIIVLTQFMIFALPSERSQVTVRDVIST